MTAIREVGPEDLSPLTQTQLEDVLRKTPEFTGDPKNGALLLSRVLEGAEWVRAQHRDVFNKKNAMPSIVLYVADDIEDDEQLAPFGYLPTKNAVVVMLNELTKDSLLPPDVIMKNEREDGTLEYHGTVPDDYFLAGIEEVDHRRYDLTHGIKSFLQGTIEEGPLARYDAQQHEFEALRAKLRAAEERKLPAVTRELLRNRIMLASVIPIDGKW